MSNPNGTSRRRSSTTSGSDHRPAFSLALAAAVTAVALAGGCSDAKLDASVKNLFQPKRTPQQYMIIAVSDSDPDIRRDAVVKVAESKKYDEDWAIKGFIAIALLEDDPQARCVAVRALGHTSDRRAAETCLKILNYRMHPPVEVQPPDDLCRWDATTALAKLTADGLPEDLHAAARDTFLERLDADSDRHVRIAAAAGLRHFAEPDVIEGLIDGLRDRDFAVVHQCELSLAWLTGVTRDCDPYLWEVWLEENRDSVFAQAGTLPDSRQPPYTSRWGKVAYDTKQFFQLVFPGRKEK